MKSDVDSSRHAGKRGLSILAAILTVAIAGALFFIQLGAYALWDDEAMDALSARGVVETGDVTAKLGDNIVAYRNGLLLVDMRHQGMPPLPAYLVAASFRIFGESAWSARLPFALCGLGFFALISWGALQLRLSLVAQILLSLGLIGNVSLLLYFRNCHYYGLGIFLSTVITYLYLYRLSTRSGQLGIAVLLGLLMTANPSWFVTLSACLFFDYIFWHRRNRLLGVQDLLRIFLPQVAFGILMLWRFNPLGTELGGYLGKNSILDRLLLYYWNWRDLNSCEFIAGVVLVVAVCGLPVWRNPWIVRVLAALFVYISSITVLSTQIVSDTSVADVRYMAGCILLCIVLGVMVILELTRSRRWLAIPLGLILFGTNLLHGGPFQNVGFRSTIFAFIGELAGLPSEPYSAAAAWINDNMKKGQSLWVLPQHMMYPLLFHAPDPVYAWQLAADNKSSQFLDLDDIHFQARSAPDYIMVFGPIVQQIVENLRSWEGQGIRYRQKETLDVFWKDLYRPELFWRRFSPVENYNKDFEAIQIFERFSPPPSGIK